MARNKKEKRLTKERMSRTGESYCTALMHIRAQFEAEKARRAASDGAKATAESMEGEPSNE